MMDLNVGVGTVATVASPLMLDCLDVDVFRLPNVDVVCDLEHLPFRNNVFRDVFCFHVLEHLQNPALGLHELMRVASRTVEIEVPHRFGSTAGSPRKAKGAAMTHSCSFRTMWFHQCLKNYRRCVRVLYDFPWDLRIHVWVYKN